MLLAWRPLGFGRPHGSGGQAGSGSLEAHPTEPSSPSSSLRPSVSTSPSRSWPSSTLSAPTSKGRGHALTRAQGSPSATTPTVPVRIVDAPGGRNARGLLCTRDAALACSVEPGGGRRVAAGLGMSKPTAEARICLAVADTATKSRRPSARHGAHAEPSRRAEMLCRSLS